jgi:hypothetical protein
MISAVQHRSKRYKASRVDRASNTTAWAKIKGFCGFLAKQ